MLKAGIVQSYYGVEPDTDSSRLADEVAARHPHSSVTIWQQDWLSLTRQQPGVIPVCDYAFCIEVIEHIAANDVPRFLSEIRKRVRSALFLSTPDATRSPHGVANSDEWKKVLREAGFEVAAISRQWTTLFVCEPNANSC
jgi:2-polyprenyl-3-methyl-5-hydroxy-6-metoxy-1,4-benzoquinol methylase